MLIPTTTFSLPYTTFDYNSGGANANDTDNGFIFIEYQFSSSDECDEEIATEEDAVL